MNTGKLVFGNLTNDIYSAALSITTGAGRQLGTLGVVNKKLCKGMDIDGEVYYAELSWTLLMKEIKKSKVTYSEISKFPAVKRDLALLLNKSVQFAEIQKIAFDSDRKLLKKVELFDVYEGKNLLPGKKSYAVNFYLQDGEKRGIQRGQAECGVRQDEQGVHGVLHAFESRDRTDHRGLMPPAKISVAPFT